MNIFCKNILLKTISQKVKKYWWSPVLYILVSYIFLLYLLVILDIFFPIDQNHIYCLATTAPDGKIKINIPERLAYELDLDRKKINKTDLIG